MSTRPSGTGGPKLKRVSMGQVFILLALVSAVLTFVIFRNLMGHKEPAKVATATRPLVVSDIQMYAGETLKSENIKIVPWPRDHYPSGEVYESLDKLVGHVLKTDVFPGQPLFRQNLAGEGSSGGLPVVIPKGHRAITILVTENKGVAGFVRPGSRVDVLGNFHYQLPEATQKSLSSNSGALLEESVHITQTILQDVLVLAIAQEMLPNTPIASGAPTPEANKATASGQAEDAAKGKVVSSVTLAVTPEQAEKISFADSRGELRLVLRPEDEHEQIDLLGAMSNDVVPLEHLMEKVLQMSSGAAAVPSPFAHHNAPPNPPEVAMPIGRATSHDVEVIEGTDKNTLSF